VVVRALLVCSVLAGCAATPAVAPRAPDEPVAPPHPPLEERGIRDDLVLARADTAMLVDVELARSLGLGALVRVALRDSSMIALDQVEQSCGFDPLERVGRVFFTEMLLGGMRLTGVELVGLSPEEALDCLARALPDSQARAIGPRPALRLGSGDLFATDAEGALLVGSEQGIAAAIGLADPMARSELEALIGDGGIFGVPTPGAAALERLDARHGTLVSAAHTSFIDFQALARHEQDRIRVQVGLGGEQLAPSLGLDLDGEIRRGLGSMVEEAGALIGDADRARLLLAPMMSAEVVRSGHRLDIAFELTDVKALGEAGEQARFRVPAYEARQLLEQWAEALARSANESGMRCRQHIVAPAEIPGPNGVWLTYQYWRPEPRPPDYEWACDSLYYEGETRHRFAHVYGGGYEGPSRGGPDPGPDGFELSAEADLDGDGKTGLITVVGRWQDGKLLVEPTFEVDELE
jgi:hypothetical protein